MCCEDVNGTVQRSDLIYIGSTKRRKTKRVNENGDRSYDF
jgi:hypothetical protein